MCKTRFGSQGVILDGFKHFFFKNGNDTRDQPPPFMANVILNFHFLILPLLYLYIVKCIFGQGLDYFYDLF